MLSSASVCLALTLLVRSSQALAIGRTEALHGDAGASIVMKSHLRMMKLKGNATLPMRHGFLALNTSQSLSESMLSAFEASIGLPASLILYAAPAQWHLPAASSRAEFWILIATSVMIWTMCVALAAYNYKGSEAYFHEIGPLPEDPAKTRRQLSKWHSEWYQCGADPDICIWSFCCPWIQWAHTMDLLHLLEFAPAFAIFFMLQLVNMLTGFIFLGVYFTALLVYYRQKLRNVFGMQNYGTMAGMVEDWFCLCFCMPCTIAQEAQHVKFAAEMGFPLPASMVEFAGRRKASLLSISPDDDTTSSSQSFHDVISKQSGSCRDSPALPQSVPGPGVFSGLFRHRSRSSSLGMAFRGNETRPRGANDARGHRRRSRSSSFEQQVERRPRAKPKPVGKAMETIDSERGASSGSTLRTPSPWLRQTQNPLPERLLAPPPVRAGEHSEVRSRKLTFVDVLVTLHDDLRAYIFLFAEVGCVGRSGASCRQLHSYIWSDRAFWQFYCGPTVNDRLAQPWVCPPHALREAFRRWVFHIDADWTKDFRAFVDQARQSPCARQNALMLSYARYIASGLMPYDSRPAVAEFTDIMCELLAEYNPERAEERNSAEAMTAQVECMAEVFTGAQIKSVLSAFHISLGRIISANSEEESEPEPAWVLAGLTGGDQEMVAEMEGQAGEDPENPWGNGAIMWFG